MEGFGTIYRLQLRLLVTRARVGGMLALGAIGLVVAGVLGAEGPGTVLAGARFVDGFGLSLLVPVTTLVFASAALGDPVEDGTMVYLWLRPVRRSTLALASTAAAVTVAWPVAVPLLVVSSGLTGAGASLVLGTALAATLGVVTYGAIFTALGLRSRRALVWGLLYVLVWEGFVAAASRSAGRLAVRAHTRSLLADVAGVRLRNAIIDAPWTWLVPLVAAAAALALTTRWLRTRDVP